MKPVTLLALAMIVFQTVRLVKEPVQKWRRLPLLLFWVLLAVYSVSQLAWLPPLMIAMIVATLAFRFWPPHLPSISTANLRPVTPEEKAVRSTFTAEEAELLEIYEGTTERRLDVAELRDFLADAQKEAAQQARDRQEDAAEEARDRAEAEEEKEMLDVSLSPEAEVRFRLSKPVELPTSEGRRTIAAGEYAGTLGFRWPDVVDEDHVFELLECHFAFSDGERRWKSRSWLRLTQAFDLQHLEVDEPVKTGVSWTAAPAEWRAAFRQRALVAGLMLMDDSRNRFVIQIGSQKHCIMTKYLCWVLALAVSDDRRTLLVRTHRMEEERYEGGPEAGDDAEFLDMERVPAFCWSLPVEAILPLTAAKLHAPSEDSEEDEEEEHAPIQFQPA